jgi:D-inositol-3-phosphate glycosyltransferase
MNVYVRDLSQELGRQKIQLDVFTRSQDDHVPHVLHDLGFGNRVVHIPAGPEHPLPKEELAHHIPAFIDNILDFAQARDLTYDLIHSHYWMSGIAAERLQAVWGAPVIQMYHTLGKLKQQVAQTAEEREGEYRIQGELRTMEMADRIVVATPVEVEQLRDLYGIDTGKVVVIPPGVDLSRFYPILPEEAKDFVGIDPQEQLLLFVGRIEPLKGIDTLLHALSRCVKSERLSEEHLFLSIIGGAEDDGRAGEHNEMDYLLDLRKEYDLENLVTFLGQKDQDTLPYYYSAADVVVMPSHYESFGMVALESMACGTPVIASRVGGLAHLVQDEITGYQFPAEDEVALCDSLLTLLTDHELRAEMGRNALFYAQQYSWKRIAERVIDLYQELR